MSAKELRPNAIATGPLKLSHSSRARRSSLNFYNPPQTINEGYLGIFSTEGEQVFVNNTM